MRKRLVILAAGLCTAVSLGLVLAGRNRPSSPLLASGTIGGGIGLDAWLPGLPPLAPTPDPSQRILHNAVSFIDLS